MSQIKDIAIHVNMVATPEMNKHAMTGPEGDHDLPFQIFRYLTGYDEALTEIRRLRDALEKIKHLVTYPNGIDAYIVADKALKTEEVSSE